MVSSKSFAVSGVSSSLICPIIFPVNACIISITERPIKFTFDESNACIRDVRRKYSFDGMSLSGNDSSISTCYCPIYD
ncbi:unnamed protein product [Pneumocystis jirovecii]|uniref:Uncharacterized protein n=1 Tax=Pneumocystis jirovecii TaxID=42068 RepID=L0P950_PNEJI|nr:unnamed protein product [Pneumocystis jirovecii]